MAKLPHNLAFQAPRTGAMSLSKAYDVTKIFLVALTLKSLLFTA
jgi:hypothetical protein